MIDNVSIINFKSIQSESIKLSSLNLITGVNSSGKSTLLQSILILKQLTPTKKTLILNGSYVELGTVSDILHQFYVDNKIEVILSLDEKEVLSVLIDNPENCLKQDHAPIIFSGKKNALNTLTKRMKYLCAERIGAEFSYNIDNYLPDLGKNGENTVSFIHENRNKKITIKSLIHKNSKNVEGLEDSLLTNINEWMKEISTGINLEFDSNPKTRISSMSAVYYSSTLFDSVSPKNFGFGISYCLPVITLILSSKEKDILLIENPEAHIHPTGQTKLGYLCAIAANAGVQLIIETHSDHFFNGIRLAIKEGKIKNENVLTYYFDKELKGELSNQSLCTKVSAVELCSDGKIKDAPTGFFDEWQNSLFKLL